MFHANNGLRKEPEEQYVIPETYIPVVFKLIHDMPTAGHPGHDRTLVAVCRVYYWPTMGADTNRYEAQCIPCAKHKGATESPAPMLQYPPPLWDVVSIYLLQLPRSHLG